MSSEIVWGKYGTDNKLINVTPLATNCFLGNGWSLNSEIQNILRSGNDIIIDEGGVESIVTKYGLKGESFNGGNEVMIPLGSPFSLRTLCYEIKGNLITLFLPHHPQFSYGGDIANDDSDSGVFRRGFDDVTGERYHQLG